MPYVEGFGTWPFGEEWLWEALAMSYLPLMDMLDAGAPLTLSLTPVLCDQLEVDGLGGRFSAFLRDVRRGTHEQDAAGLRAGGHEQLARELERSWQDYAGALEALERRAGDVLGGFSAHAQWTSSATHAVLPLLVSDAGMRMQVQTGINSHRRRSSADWRGGFWLPECAYAPWLLRGLEDAGVAAVCVELSDRFGIGSDEHLLPRATDSGVVLVPIDRASMALVWSDRGYPAAGAYRDYHHHTTHHHNPWNNAGAAYDHSVAVALAREHAEDFVARTLERLRRANEMAPAGGLPGGGLVVCALDTELLGHWWYEGIEWMRAVLEECERQDLELVRLDDALERIEPVPLPVAEEAGVSTWGQGGDLSTWSGPKVADMAFAARASELEVLAAGSRVSTSAVRELLALQASDWPFMVSREIAVPYARERFAGHRRALALALADDAGVRGEIAIADAAAGPRNLAIDADRAALLAP